jgi:hypothetical protein
MMKSIYVFILSVFSVANAYGGTPIDVFILSGQSNAVGIAHETQLGLYAETDVLNRPLISYKDPDETVLYAHRDMRFTDGGLNYDQELGALRTKPNQFFGPEQSLGRDLSAMSQRPVAFLKFVSGGSALSHWHPDGNNLYTPFVEYLNEEKTLLEAQGFEPTWSGLFWVQGESEGYSAQRAGTYDQVFDEFVTQLRTDLSAPDMPVVMSALKTNLVHYDGIAYEDLNENLGIVNQVMSSYSESHPFALTRSNNDLPLSDGIHYRVDSVIELGHRLYLTYRNRFQPNLVGDITRDGSIDASDFQILSEEFSSAGFDGVRRADFTFDGYVDAADACAIFQNWTGDSILLPEPSLFRGFLCVLLLITKIWKRANVQTAK